MLKLIPQIDTIHIPLKGICSCDGMLNPQAKPFELPGSRHAPEHTDGTPKPLEDFRPDVQQRLSQLHDEISRLTIELQMSHDAAHVASREHEILIGTLRDQDSNFMAERAEGIKLQNALSDIRTEFNNVREELEKKVETADRNADAARKEAAEARMQFSDLLSETKTEMAAAWCRIKSPIDVSVQAAHQRISADTEHIRSANREVEAAIRDADAARKEAVVVIAAAQKQADDHLNAAKNRAVEAEAVARKQIHFMIVEAEKGAKALWDTAEKEADAVMLRDENHRRVMDLDREEVRSEKAKLQTFAISLRKREEKLDALKSLLISMTLQS